MSANKSCWYFGFETTTTEINSFECNLKLFVLSTDGFLFKHLRTIISEIETTSKRKFN